MSTGLSVGLRGIRFCAPAIQVVSVKPSRMGWARGFDARGVGVAVGADGVAGLADAHEIGETEVCARLEVFVVEAGFEAGDERAAGVDVVAQLLALAVAEHRDVGQQQRAIFGEAFGFEAVFVHEVEGEAALEQRVVDALRRLVHVAVRTRGGGAGVEELRALSDDDAEVGDGAARSEVCVVRRCPAEELFADFLPAAVFGEAVLRADEVEVRHHAAGERFVEPHGGFGGSSSRYCASRGCRWSRRR